MSHFKHLFKNLAIKHKLLIMVGAPLLLAFFFITTKFLLLKQTANQMSHAYQLSEVAVVGNQLVHEIQKERGISAVYISSQGQRFGEKLTEQRKLSNQLIEAYKKTYNSHLASITSPELVRLTQNINQKLQALKDLRSEIDELSIPLGDALGQLTALNTDLLNINTQMSVEVSDPDISRLATSYVYFLQAKERAGIERAVIASVLSNGKATPTLKKKALTLEVEQKNFISLFRSLSNEQLLKRVEAHFDPSLWQNIEQVRQEVWNKNQDYNIAAADWFAMATERINRLKKAEVSLEQDFQETLAHKQESSNATLQSIAIASILGALLTIGLCAYSIRTINRQLDSISSAMHQLGNESDLTVSAEAMSKDDLGQLARSFNKMVNHIRRLIENMKQADNSLNTTLHSLQDISKSVNEQVSGGMEQTQMAAVAMNEMGSTVQEVALNCSSAAERSERANSSAEAGNRMLNSVRAEMQSLSSELNSTNDVIQQLATDSSEIGSILDVIRGVAEQTNLLALNAAIEAARAGEQGRGFAVVADEVRSLASKTQESTGQIQSNIEKLQQGSQQAVKAIGDSLELAASTDSSLNNTVGNIETIIHQIADVNSMNIQIATATEEQSSTVEEINRNVQFIQQQYDETNGSIQQLNTATEEVNQLSQQLTDNVKQFKL